jgi:tryptophan 2,3-dioxygenase
MATDPDWVPMSMSLVRDMAAKIAALEAEVVRLRAALTEIQEIPDDWYNPDWDQTEMARRIAKAALSQEYRGSR